MNARVCRAGGISLTGLHGTLVTVEAAVSSRLPGIDIIGLPDTALTEAKLRVRSATETSGLGIAERHLTINLSPAALPKQGSGFDLAIALAALAALALIPEHNLASTCHIAELGLDGTLRRPAGLLPAVLAAKQLGMRRVMVPSECAEEASLISDIEVIALPNLLSAVAWHRNGSVRSTNYHAPSNTADKTAKAKKAEREKSAGNTAQAGTEHTAAAPLSTVANMPQLDATSVDSTHATESKTAETETAETIRKVTTEPDMADVLGQDDAVFGLTVAAAGGHHVSMLGPPGAGKTMLAARLATILPNLTPAESLTATSIAALGGSPIRQLVTRPPFVAPHHTASAVAIIGGGGSSKISAGAITHACHGVLFLDEAPEFGRAVLDALRQPLETGLIEIHRAHAHTTLPAKFQLVLAANPCPCGKSGTLDTALSCVCSAATRTKYLQRISGPLADRIDVRLTLRRVQNAHYAATAGSKTRTSADIRRQVVQARQAAAERLVKTPWNSNAEVPGTWLRGKGALPRQTTALIDAALQNGKLTLRGYDRVLRLAWTIADLHGKTSPDRECLADALQLRGNGMP